MHQLAHELDDYIHTVPLAPVYRSLVRDFVRQLKSETITDDQKKRIAEQLKMLPNEMGWDLSFKIIKRRADQLKKMASAIEKTIEKPAEKNKKSDGK